MEYFVIGADGKDYGPATQETLESWAAENRIEPTTRLRDSNGQTMPASNVIRAFAAARGSMPPVQPQQSPALSPMIPGGSNYQRNPSADWSRAPAYAAVPRTPTGYGPLINVIVRSALGIVFFFVLHGIGLIFAGYSLYYAIRAKTAGYPHAVLMIAIAGISVALIAVGWALRLGGTAAF